MAGGVQPPVVVPVDPLEGVQFDVVEAVPGPATANRLRVQSAGVVCVDLRVIFVVGQALSAGMVTSSVAESVSWSATGRMRQRARTSRPR